MASAGIILFRGVLPGKPRIDIQHAEAVRSPMMIGVVSVFMDIANTGSGKDELLSVKTSLPKTVAMLHDVKDGKMVMRDKIDIPSGSVTILKPGGTHIMLFNMPDNLGEGAVFTLFITFEKSGERQVPVKVVARQLGSEHPM